MRRYLFGLSAGITRVFEGIFECLSRGQFEVCGSTYNAGITRLEIFFLPSKIEAYLDEIFHRSYLLEHPIFYQRQQEAR